MFDFDSYPNERLYYPSYHFRPEMNWMNDPNGLIFLNGWYHLFFQYNPRQDIWGDIHWGHARSRDLIHWEDCPVALSPSYTEGEVHCYSGCAVHHNGSTYLFYTSIGQGLRGPEHGAQQWSAWSSDPDLMTWTKHGMPAVPAELHAPNQVSMWRDPFIWKEQDTYYLLLSGSLSHPENARKEGAVLLYSSDDLEQWSFGSVFYTAPQYELIECPNIMKFGDRYLLLYAPLDAVRYAVGSIDPVSRRFIAEEEGIFDYSILKKGFYATNIYLNSPDGRYICFGCLFEGDRLQSSMPRGWAGMQSLPREIRLEDGQLQIRPARECRSLRGEKTVFAFSGGSDAPEPKPLASGGALEFLIELEDDRTSVFELELFRSSKERTVLTADLKKRTLTLDRSASTLHPDITTELLQAPLKERRTPEASGPVVLDLFLDHSAIEIFCNDSVTMSARVFPSLPESIGHRLLPGAAKGLITVYELRK